MIENFIKLNKFDVVIGKEKILKKISIPEIFISVVDDLRSATFMANGIKQRTDKKVLIVTEDQDFADAYTAFFEAWFQKNNIFVLLLSNSGYVDPMYNRCFSSIVNYEEGMIVTEKNAPALIIYSQSELINKHGQYYYSFILKNYKGKIFSSKSFTNMFDESIIEYNSKGNTGLISAYVGFMVDSRKNILCICDEKQLLLDLNIFNCRYVTPFFKLLVFGSKTKSIQWIKENGFVVFNEDQIEEFILSKNKSVCFVEGE